jgi:hypothetical protein
MWSFLAENEGALKFHAYTPYGAVERGLREPLINKSSFLSEDIMLISAGRYEITLLKIDAHLLLS